jgi:SAM-dependent methyltransferase
MLSRAMRTVPRPLCLCCGTVGIPLYQDLEDGLFSAPGSWSLKKCPAVDCGLLWLDPMPLAADLSAAYHEYYTHGAPLRSLPGRLGSCLNRLLIDTVLLFRGTAERKRAELMFMEDVPPTTLLDVGCGEGSFLVAMAKRGWHVTGVDFDEAAVHAARQAHGLDVHTGTIDTIVARGMTFDVVTASHVIEHVPDPVEFLAQCVRVLRPGGRVILRTPNAHSWGHQRYGRAWRGLEPPRHLHIFTTAALSACARKAGFADARFFTSPRAAEIILTESHFLATKGSFRPAELSLAEKLRRRVVAPTLALQAQLAWDSEPDSGEELYAVLTVGDR